MNNQENTLYESINRLRKQGYTHDFEIDKEGKMYQINGKTFSAEEVILDETHRFEGMTNPSDSSILYAIHTITGLKGTIVDAYGADGSKAISDFMNQLEQN